MIQEIQLSPVTYPVDGSGALRVERRGDWGWSLRHMMWVWAPAPGVAVKPGAWRRDARLGVE